MPEITPTSRNITGAVSTVALDGATDTFTLKAGVQQRLYFTNGGGAAVPLVLLGDLPPTTKDVSCAGIDEPVDVSGGKTLNIPNDGAPHQFNPKNFPAFLEGSGLVNITGGTSDVTAWLIEG